MTRFTAEIPIGFSDVDMFGHVNHVRYLTYCEHHRTIMFDRMAAECGTSPLESGFVVRHLECDYRDSVGFRDRRVTVACSVEHFGRTSVRLYYSVSVGNRIAAVLRTTIVLVGSDGPRAITDSERSWLSTYRHAADSCHGSN